MLSLRGIKYKNLKSKKSEYIKSVKHKNEEKRLANKSLQVHLVHITAPIEKTLSTADLSTKKEDEKSTISTALIFNKKVQSKGPDEHSTAPRINMIQAFQKLKENFPKNKCFISELIKLEHYRNMGDLVIKNIDHK
uniref:Uncharacterized protein n=1 Tax=Schizaphis graminum TaxID=13262 RepID=A0A2S2P496_SCHGA